MFLVVRAELVSVCCQLTAICPGCSFCLPCWCLWRQHLVLSAGSFCSLLFCESLSGGGKADWRRRKTLERTSMRRVVGSGEAVASLKLLMCGAVCPETPEFLVHMHGYNEEMMCWLCLMTTHVVATAVL